MIAAGSVSDFKAAFNRVIRGGTGALRGLVHPQVVNPALYASGRTYADRIDDPVFFYSKRVVPQGGRFSRSVGAARRSVRAVGHTEASALYGGHRRGRVAGVNAQRYTSAAVVMGDRIGTTHARVLEAGRKARPFMPGKTGPLPGQRIFGRGLRVFAPAALDTFVRAIRQQAANRVYAGPSR